MLKRRTIFGNILNKSEGGALILNICSFLPSQVIICIFSKGLLDYL